MAPLLEVGLTGGIAAGKSAVLSCLADAGCHTLDLDRVAHAVMAPGGGAFDAVVEAFGKGILDAEGRIDRARLGAVVFADEAARRLLGSLVHPRVREEQRRRARELEAGPGGVLVVDAALLVETGTHLGFDRLVVVDVAPDVQLRRLRQRDGLSETAARQRIQAQMPVAEKRRYAHVVIDNSGERARTGAAAARLAVELRELARAPGHPVAVERQRIEAALAAGPGRGPASPAAILESLCSDAGPDLAALSRSLRPDDEGPWYAARDGDPTEALGLAVPTAVWALGQRGEDVARLAGAAFSLARLWGAGEDATAGLVLATLAAAGGALRGLTGAWRDGRGAWESETERWCGRRPALPASLEAALAHPTAAAAARAAAPGETGGAVAAALVALATGFGDRPSDEAVRRAAAVASGLIRPRR